MPLASLSGRIDRYASDAVRRSKAHQRLSLALPFDQSADWLSGHKTHAVAFGPTRVAFRPADAFRIPPDAQRAGQGVVVEQPVRRSSGESRRFTSTSSPSARPLLPYPPTMTSAQYVDSLNANAVERSTSERDQRKRTVERRKDSRAGLACSG